MNINMKFSPKFVDIYIAMRNILISILLVIMCSAAFAADGYLSDPMTIGVGARSLGMGRAYVGVAEDGDAVFVNPAGLALIKGAKLSSMYTSLLNDVDYMVVGGAFPISEDAAIGAGLINSSTGGIGLTDGVGTPYGVGRYSNSVMFLSYGQALTKDILVGGSLKYFSFGGTGTTEIDESAGTGVGADVSLLIPATDYLTLGATYQNVAGGTISRGSTIIDQAPSDLKVGAKLEVIGKEGLSYHRSRKLNAVVDYDSYSNGYPSVAHYGLEFWPNENLAFRTGSDNGEFTAGLGLRYAGVEFNYAYHPFDGLAANNTQFFSFSYLGEVGKRTLQVHIDQPVDKSIVHADNVTVTGRVEVIEPEVSEGPQAPVSNLIVKVNGVNVLVNKDLTFKGEVPLSKIGKNMIVVEANGADGEYTASEDIRIVRLIQFADVPEGHWALNPIENTGTVGLVQGYPDNTFQPDRPLTRAELATLLVRAKGLPLPERRAERIFPDVDPDFWAAKYIEVAYKAGLVVGYEEDGTFRPNREISNAEGAAVLVRFDNKPYPAELVEKPFNDVEKNFWAAKAIQAAKEGGMLTFVENNSFKPKESLIRSEMVKMLSTTSLAGQKIEDLYTWEKGFIKEYRPAKPGPGA